MKRKLALSMITTVMVLSSSITALAAPEPLQVNGETILFDYEYYAENNADVVAIYGMDKDALALHYVTSGLNEGRLPYAPGTDISAYQQALEKKTLKKKEYYKNGVLEWERFYDEQENEIRYVGKGGYWKDYTYDNMGNLIREIDSTSIGKEYIYDNHGNQIKELTIANGETKSSSYPPSKYEYDSRGKKIKQIEYNVDGSVLMEWDYSYDSYGNLIKEDHHSLNGAYSSVHQYYYDSHGNEIQSIWTLDAVHLGASGVERGIEYNYGSQGNLIKRTEYGKPFLGMAMQGAVSYSFDSSTRTFVPDPNGVFYIIATQKFSYDSWGNLIRLTRYTGSETSSTYIWSEYSYDSQGNIILENTYTSATIGEREGYVVYIYE